MRFSTSSAIAILIFLFKLSECYAQTQQLPYQQNIVAAPYQVSLYLVSNYRPSNAIHNYPLCSATIIHPFFLITSAACVHFHYAFNYSRPVSANSFYIVGGNFTEVRSNFGHLQSIHVHPQYNSVTNANNIAIMTLETPFDLHKSKDFQWVQLADNSTSYNRCYYSLFSANATKTSQAYPFSKPQHVPIVNSTICNVNASHQYEALDQVDICSYYQFEHPALCELNERQLRFNYDRGAALLCDDKLAGILSIVIPADHSNASAIHCNATSQSNVYFTKIALHSDWIQSVILSNDTAELLQGMPIKPNAPAYQTIVAGTASKKPSHSVAAAFIKSDTTILLTFVTCLFAYGFLR